MSRGAGYVPREGTSPPCRCSDRTVRGGRSNRSTTGVTSRPRYSSTLLGSDPTHSNGLDGFSHLDVVFVFHRRDPDSVETGAAGRRGIRRAPGDRDLRASAPAASQTASEYRPASSWGRGDRGQGQRARRDRRHTRARHETPSSGNGTTRRGSGTELGAELDGALLGISN